MTMSTQDAPRPALRTDAKGFSIEIAAEMFAREVLMEAKRSPLWTRNVAKGRTTRPRPKGVSVSGSTTPAPTAEELQMIGLERLDMPGPGLLIGYVRVTPTSPTRAEQISAIGRVDRLFEEMVSGGPRADRTALTDCILFVGAGDTVRVASTDRLGRSMIDLHRSVEQIVAEGATVTFVKESQTYSAASDDPMGRLLLHTLGAFAELERNLVRERQAEGIRVARAAGKYKGRAKKLGPDELARAVEQIRIGIPKSQVARTFGVNRATIYRALSESPPDRDGSSASL